MFVVVLTRIAGSVDDEAPALAAALGTTAYEERLKLLAGLPAVILSTVERAAAASLLAGLRARGHGAVAFDASTVVGSGAMVSMRQFVFEGDAIALGSGQRLPYADLLGLFRASHRSTTETVSATKDKKFSMGRALLTGGLLVSKSVTREERSTTHERDQVLYLFRSSGATPWLLRERGTVYTALGAALSPSSTQNFATTVEWLRQRAPAAVYDDRLTKLRGGPVRIARSGGASAGSVTVSSASGTDLLAHAIALAAASGVC